MKAVVYYDENSIRCEDVETPKIKEGEILVRMKVCGICGGDLMHWYRTSAQPVVLGHEITGEIVETGNGVAKFKPGDRVCVHHHVACLSCRFCNHGDYIHCDQYKKNRIYPGGMAEYIRVSAPIVRSDVHLLPDSLSYEHASLSEPLACCIKGMDRTNLAPGDSVAVIGAGTVGIMNILLAKKIKGASFVIASDVLENRRQYAKRFGADLVLDPTEVNFAEAVKEATGGIGVDAVIVAVSNSNAILQGLNAVRNGGVVLIFAPPAPDDEMTVSTNMLFFTEKRIVSSYNSSHVDMHRAFTLIASKTLDLDAMITHKFPMQKAAEAFSAAQGRDGLKVLVTNQ
ncbi:MAG: alcohol dehydrogenase catalytic domain-containing protein [Spirochaetes bacterium]|nr:alcohol dehydrogenase catalytic domain-containing protein [Spirochaetota bacterium]